MALDPNIILQGQQYDPMQGIGKAMQLSALMRQNDLQGLQADQARQELKDTTTLRDLYRGAIGADGNIDRSALIRGAAEQGLGAKIPGLQKGLLEMDKAGADLSKTRAETGKIDYEMLTKRVGAMNGAFSGLLSRPTVTHQDVYQALGGLVQSGIMRTDEAEAAARTLPVDPAQLRQFLMQKAMESADAGKRLEMLMPKPEALDLGGSRTFVDKNPLTNPGLVGQRFDKTVSPDAAAKASAASKPPAGYRWTANGSLEAIPGGPVDTKTGSLTQKTADAREVLALLDQAEPLLDKATGSYVGAGMDSLNRAFGKSTQGAQSAAQLKALEGSLVAKMPKMSGPQSDKDVLLYRQMAGEIGDPTVPAAQKRAAIKMIREINQRYLGESSAAASPAPGGGPAVTEPASLPFVDASRVSGGRIAPPAPKAGAREDGYIFLGGDPSDPKRWKPAGGVK